MFYNKLYLILIGFNLYSGQIRSNIKIIKKIIQQYKYDNTVYTYF